LVYVSRLEMRGFKSFGSSKVFLPFSRGLTAIIGPNGCGKSNIVDAFGFVLGWTSAKQMRSERLSELLFNGGNGGRRAPFAEVSLFVNNADGALPTDSKEVILTRRVDRSGKCTYRINRKRATRQEIVDLLAPVMSSSDGGGYNFVMQGDVDRFIKMNPLERRQVIDDLAGVAEYDEKRERSLAQLQRVESGLQSMSAVLNEMASQMERLKHEREGALRYKELTGRLDWARAVVALVRRDELTGELADIGQKISVKEAERSRLHAKLGEIESDLRKREDKLKRIEKLIDERSCVDAIVAAERLRERVGQLAGLIASTGERHAEVEKEIARILAAVKESAGGDGAGREHALLELNTLLAEFARLRGEFGAAAAKLEEAITPAEIRKTLSRLNDVLAHIQRAISDIGAILERAPELVGSDEIDEFRQMLENLHQLEGRRTLLDQQLAELREAINEANRALREASERERGARESLRRMESERTKLEAGVRALEGKARRLGEKARGVEGELQACRIREAELKAKLEGVESGLKRVRGKVRVPERANIAELGREIEKMDGELQALGEVNLLAIREFKSAERRYLSQRRVCDKLEGERLAILRVLGEIDRKKTQVFMRTFNEISKNFGEIFSVLSPGGSAALVLENQEHPLEGGLEIEARPAGKTLSVDSMSGGEKALTALALIFAIQRARPAGFYVLDEIDAHLDDDNRHRVAELLGRYSRNSQIVVITLHDATAAVADRVFGVTMDSKKVTQLLSVKLEGVAA